MGAAMGSQSTTALAFLAEEARLVRELDGSAQRWGMDIWTLTRRSPVQICWG